MASLGIITITAVTLDRMFPPNLARLAQVGTEVVDKDGRIVALAPAPGGVWRFRTTVADVSPVFVDMLVATEDRHFWRHPGINPLALLRASLQDLRAGHIVSGGSTLTMQAARLLEPRPRTLRSKLIELVRAVQLEAHFSKRQILSIWMTLAPYGGNLEGVRAGSLAWFGVPPGALEPAQAALLVAIPRRPEALRPDRHAARARRLRDRILHADGGAMPTLRQPMPRHAPQVVAALEREDRRRDRLGSASPDQIIHAARIATTLDANLQQAVERLADDRLRQLPSHVSLAMLIADVHSREIRAIVSGGTARSEARAWALDLTRAVRSPGSALKPFIYAMAFQDGIAGPETRVDDLPRRFGAYAPEDFDRSFSGTVTAAQALQQSLNLPAVALLDRVGPIRFVATLKEAGVRLVLPRGADPSLPIALGGAGITLRDAAGLYAALATDGTAIKLRLRADDPATPQPFLQRRAAASIAAVLTHRFPDGGPTGVAWKTGTSWGGRDAWALGFDSDHVAAVWIGRPDGTPVAGATGASMALPMLARLFGLLPAAPRPEPPPLPAAREQHTAHADSLRLLFPPPGAVLGAPLSGDASRVVLRAMGGRRPLTFLVDGAPLATDPARREAAWRPTAPGFYRLTVLDAAGGAAHASVRVKERP